MTLNKLKLVQDTPERKLIIISFLIFWSIISWFTINFDKINLIKLIEITLSLIGILFGFFIINFTFWNQQYPELLKKDIDVLTKVIGKYEKPKEFYAISVMDLYKKTESIIKDTNNQEITEIYEGIKIRKKFNNFIKNKFLFIIYLFFFILFLSLLTIVIEKSILTEYLKINFIIILGLFLIWNYNILQVMMIVNYPTLKIKN